ncbi:MAG: hypothetical protein PHI32_12015 [Dysgonamonadaceae bacterium]|nr:hypothetical protein [Dysgonamonadaceae bacterium]
MEKITMRIEKTKEKQSPLCREKNFRAVTAEKNVENGGFDSKACLCSHNK